jgi:diadenosine tetraphosphatase ApaH/serine/threonine PP2A family protein phosphatase
MKIAVLGDIHGNLEALQTVLEDIDTQKPDRIYSVGDLVGYGADPSACIARIREREIPAIKGNQDVAVLDDSVVEQFNPYAKASIYWTRGALSFEEKDILENLPYGITEDEYEIAHGMPGDNTFRYLMKIEDAAEAFELSKVPVIFVGHTHVPAIYLDTDPIEYVKELEYIVPADTRCIVNVGSVGQPRDNDPRAAYGLYDTETREVKIIRIEYDNKTACEKIIKAGLPPILGERLIEGK